MSIERKTSVGFWSAGEHFVWATGGALTLIMMMAITLIVVVVVNGMGIFWPSEVTAVKLINGQKAMGELKQLEETPDGKGQRFQFKIGNRDLYGLDFRWINDADITNTYHPEDVVVLERMEYGNFYGFLQQVHSPQGTVVADDKIWAEFDRLREFVAKKQDDIKELSDKISKNNRQVEGYRLEMLGLQHDGVPDTDERIQVLERRQNELKKEFEILLTEQNKYYKELHDYYAVFADINGREKQIALMEIVRYTMPNQMGIGSKLAHYAEKIRELIMDEPRESNTEGGLYPAIFGTVILIIVMSLFSFPLGVITAIYLREYAKEGLLVRMVRIAVNNLAGIPSIVYGVFGLGFFVYGVGGFIDDVFFPERLPSPTFGTGGILWASLTLALLTVPVVIVASEEAMGSLPKGMREASLALGATKYQTILRVVLPMASPGIMTGFILAMARAAGEVAPLMITGVVKLAPSLAIDGIYPFFHLERKFMHLGFHIYDVGFQSPNVEAAKPMVFVTTLLLVLIVLAMSSVAIYLRNKMKERYSIKSF